MRTRAILQGARYLLIGAVLCIAVFPVLWMFLTSFKRPLEAFTLPPVFLPVPPATESWQWLLWGMSGAEMTFGGLRTERILLLAWNSIVASVSSTGLSLALAIFGAYALARFRFRGRVVLGLMIIGTRMLPPIATVLPFFVLFRSVNLLDTRLCLVLAYTALSIPFAIWMLVGFFREIPVELEESAMVDGCTRLGALFRVVLPLAAPGLAATAILSFLLAWNDFQLAFFLTSDKARTLTLASVIFTGEEGIHWGPMSAFGTAATIPVLVFALFAQKHIARGLTLGAVKG